MLFDGQASLANNITGVYQTADWPNTNAPGEANEVGEVEQIGGSAGGTTIYLTGSADS